MVSFTTLLTLLPLALASPTLHPRDSGDITYYNPGLGACGFTNSDNDYIVAVSTAVWAAGNPCGRTMRVTGIKGSVDVTVVDKCMACAPGDVDLSPIAFEACVGDEGIGRSPGSWVWTS